MTENIKIFFLGTSASLPTKNRNLSSLLINYKGENILFDCSENTQTQILKVNQSLLKISSIFLTHLHGDHFYGLFGLLSSMSLYKRNESLTIYVPKGYLSYLKGIFKSLKLNLSFTLNIKELKPNSKVDFTNFQINSIKLNHSIETYGYIFKIKDKVGKFNKKEALKLKIPEGPLYSKLKEGKSIKLNGKTIYPKQVIDYSFKKKGSKIIYFTDTAVLKKQLKSFQFPEILIHECTFSNLEKEKAKKMKHSFSEEVSKFAKKINAKYLYLTHISSRYKEPSLILKESKQNFKNTFVAKDLDIIEIKDYF